MTAVRLDLPGIGDSAAGDEGIMTDADFYTPQRTEQVSQALDALVEQGLPGRFVLAGLCSGAYWSFELARDDPRVRSIALLNPLALLWEQSRTGAYAPPELLRLTHWSSWRKVVSGQASWAGVRAVVRSGTQYAVNARTARRALRSADLESAGVDALVQRFDELAGRGVAVTLAFSDDEALLRSMRLSGQLEALTARGSDVRLLGGPGSSHTLAPERLQHAALAVLAEAASGPRWVGSPVASTP